MSAVFLGGNAAFRVRCGVLGRDAARHVATKAVRGLCIDGHRLERKDIPDNADCRGGVFAVFAKISPPVLAAFRGYGVDMQVGQIASPPPILPTIRGYRVGAVFGGRRDTGF